MSAFERSRLFEGVHGEDRARRERALLLAEAALDAVEPGRATREALARIERAGGRLDGATLFAFGKASVPMARAAAASVRLAGGIVVALEPAEIDGLDVVRGAHPIPASDAAETGAEVLARARALGPGDVALCLVSGGGSSMLELPVEGVSMAELARVTRALLHRGADIAELNAVRRGLSQLKGGGLARAMNGARVFNVVLSDVPGHPPELVASGPTCAPPLGAPDPRDVLVRYGLGDVVRHLVLPSPPSTTIITEIAADNAAARRAIVKRAAELGVALDDREGFFSGEARALGAGLGARDRGWVWGGETTVTVRGHGRGGRNQELVLGALAGGWTRGLLLAFGTDGIDGTSDAAGALVDPAAVARARALGLDPERALATNDAYSFFDALGTALVCGPTGTNVADLCLYLP